MIDPLDAVRDLGAILDAMDVAWAVGGSVASSFHGQPRTTYDVDVLVRLRPKDVADFAARCGDRILIDGDALLDAIRAGRAYNVFHAETMMKVDLFPAVDAFHREELRRAVVVGGIAYTSAEDTILAKLAWYRRGAGASERQLQDVRSVIETQRGRLDRAYLERWGVELGVVDLVQRALAD